MITVITPTADRPFAWPLAEKWMARQTVQPDLWIVSDDGHQAAPITMGQTHIRRERTHEGGASLAMNLLSALPHVPEGLVFIIEDDDAYRPDHIEVQARRLADVEATGCRWMDYYNVEHRKWKVTRNACAALCNTAFRSSRLPDLEAAAKQALAEGIYHVDRLFWQRVGYQGLHDERTVVGIKGLPGSAGIGVGHRPGRGWQPDPQGRKLRQWIGEDAACYGL